MNATENTLAYQLKEFDVRKNSRPIPQTYDLADIHWKQVWSLAALFASIVIGWIAYFNYQPALLQSFGLQKYAFTLVVAQGVILFITPPLAGLMGDYFRKRNFSRLPIITIGICFAAMVFMTVAFTLFQFANKDISNILFVLVLLWLFSMSIFTSPALSTFELFGPFQKLPQIMAILTIVTGLVYSLEPVIVNIINFVGAPSTFALGGMIVLISGWNLRKNSMHLLKGETKDEIVADRQRSNFGLVFILGIGLGLATTFLFNILPATFNTKLGMMMPESFTGSLAVSVVLALSALVSLPMSKYVQQQGLKKSGWTSAIFVASIVVSILLINSPSYVLFSILLLPFGFSAISVSFLPLALQNINSKAKVFGVGIFFSGVELANAMVEVLLAN